MKGASIRALALIGAAVSVIGLHSVASAQQVRAPGWYFGGNIGIGLLDESDNQTRTSDTFDPGTPVDPGTPATCTVPVGPFCAGFDPGTPGSPGTPPSFTPGTTQRSVTSFDNGVTLGFTIGHAFESGLRPEFAFSYAKNDLESITFIEGYDNLNGMRAALSDGKVESYNFMANAWYDVTLQSNFVPYFGGGLGGRIVEQSSSSANSAGKQNDFVAGGQLGAGLAYAFTELLSLSVDYRYLLSGDPTFTGDNGEDVKTEYNLHQALISARYAFSPTKAKDSDGDGVPDFADKCPGTTAGVIVNASGCPKDSDNDGVPDIEDECPNSKPGVPVGKNGCAQDSDKDGVPDALDQCPNTPIGAPVNAQGCPKDTDGDGVPDYLDKCPNSKAGDVVDVRGCSFVDSDGDGVANYADKCPGTKPGIPVDEEGCPKDSDGDGVPDYLDECPKTPAGLKVLPNGCALKGDRRLARPGEAADADGYAIDRDFILRGVNFELDSDRLTAEAKVILDNAAEVLKFYPDVKVDVEGHTDSLGSDGYNQGLSEKRAISVEKYLIIRGIPDSQLTPIGYGETRPIDSNSTEVGRANNRRVAFRARD